MQKAHNNKELFSNYYLEERLPDRKAWQEPDGLTQAYQEISELYEEKKDILKSTKEAQTEEEWIKPILKILGFKYITQPSESIFDTTKVPDYAFFLNDEDKKKAYKVAEDNKEDLFNFALAVGDAKRWGRNLNELSPNKQIDEYLRITDSKWGILTNGRLWRIYHLDSSYRLDTYYEVDLVDLIEAGDAEKFKYFYLFFRPNSFVEDGFLIEVYERSEDFTTSVSEDLKENAFDALRELCQGFLSGNPELGEEDLDDIYENSLVLLYRLIFLLYAESEEEENLLPMDNETYRETYSLQALKEKAMEKHNTGSLLSSSHQYWSRLRDLFSFIDKGQEQLGVYEYNGGLFDSDRHPFFKENSIGDKYIAEAIRKVSYSEAEGGFIDYQDLDVRELGAIYEGLLEHKPVIEEEQVKWEEDISERKKTGSYYTPEYIVKYIVENTIDPLVEEKKEEIEEEINELKEKLKGSRGYDRETYQRKLEEKRKEVRKEILDLKILDPAMGSGHFLVEATEKLANSIASLEEEFSPNKEEKLKVQETEKEDTVKELKRQIVERSIYGVDKNPLATELAKLSLWLHTVAKGEPLSFLDHHLRTGDSLIGIDIEEMKTMPSEREHMAGLFTSNLVQDLGNAIGHLNLIEEITSESRDDVQEKKAEWRDVRSWIDKYKKAANVRLSTSFGNEVSDDDYRKVLQAAANNDMQSLQEEEFFQKAQEVAENKSFFHWKLEFPDVFRNKQGKRKSDSGFDVVVGNPPYVEFKRLSKDIKNSVTPLFDSCKGKFDLYIPFVEQSIEISKRKTALIAPSMFMKRDYGKELRNYIQTHATLDTIVEFEDIQIFRNVTNFTSIFITNKKDSHEINYINVRKRNLEPRQILKIGFESYKKVPQKQIGKEPWQFITPKQKDVLEKMKRGSKKLGAIVKKISVGIQTGKDSVFLKKKKEISEKNFKKDVWKPIVRGRDIHRWTTLPPDTYVFYPYTENGKLIEEEKLKTEYPTTYSYLQSKRDVLKGRTYFENSNKKWYELWCPRNPSIFIETPKILVQEISNHNKFSIDQQKRYFNTKVFGILGSDININYLLSVLNSKLLEFQFKNLSVPKRGGYFEYKTQFLKDLSINFDQERSEKLIQYSKNLVELSTELKRQNLNILDFIGNYRNGCSLGKIYSPQEGLSNTTLQETTTSKNNLKISEVDFEENMDQLILKVATRYKPEEKHESLNLDQWGYTLTKLQPAMHFSVHEKMKYLIKEFVPIAVEKAGGFANFRKNTTKTISLIDRLEKLFLAK